ncbi:MAG: mannose-1-phosphate guanylyltransferase [Holophagaceae bacterium]|uniref:mannose-1-phosphate guanylyltransferase n=1 Tax=Candidatus Geothrix skivensis TaxID=2954439 RepID=A0A9D7XLZ9_9BACT|nr:mannose-1-phosphate guanylyltransferase [Candidatus Geothrix skivensis]
MDTPNTIPTVAVVMAGGRGTRFWPRSRNARPKQFLAIVGEETLLHQTVRRLDGHVSPDHIFVVTTEDLAAETRRMLPELPPENVIVEPEGRNTAPCLALALVEIEKKYPRAVMAVLSADHWIGDRELFLEDLDTAVAHAAGKRELVTFGIKPTYPETGYGYIESEGQGPVFKVKAFREKPPADVALQYLESGRHYWNAGMFVWTLADLRAGLRAHAPEVLAPLDAWVQSGAQPEALAAAYAQLPKVAIDVALMERAETVAVVPTRFRWSDVGSWPAAIEFQKADGDGNVSQGQTLLLDTRNSAFFGGKRLIAASGVEDLIVVDAEDALLICHRDKAQSVKQIVERLKAEGREDLL